MNLEFPRLDGVRAVFEGGRGVDEPGDLPTARPSTLAECHIGMGVQADQHQGRAAEQACYGSVTRREESC